MGFNKKYAEYYDLFNQGKDYSKECDFLEAVFKTSPMPIKKILDLGCGTGLHDVELLKRGYDVTGLDLSEEMVEIAKKRNPKINFGVADMSNFNLNEKFDAIICMFSSIGYLTKNKQIENFFRKVKDHLKEGGLLVIDCWSGLGVMHELPTSREKSFEIGGIKVIRKSFPTPEVQNHVSNVKFDIKVLKNGLLIDEYEEKHQVRFFFPQELRKYMEDESFELINICPSYNLNETLTEKDWNMVLVGKLKTDSPLENYEKKNKIVMVSGGFDPLHLGHLIHFKEAKKLGDKLIVVIDGDSYVINKKGKIFMPVEDRKAIIEELKCVDEVIALEKDKTNISEAILKIKPNILAKGGDVISLEKFSEEEIEACRNVGCLMLFNVGGSEKIRSSSDLLKKWSE